MSGLGDPTSDTMYREEADLVPQVPRGGLVHVYYSALYTYKIAVLLGAMLLGTNHTAVTNRCFIRVTYRFKGTCLKVLRCKFLFCSHSVPTAFVQDALRKKS